MNKQLLTRIVLTIIVVMLAGVASASTASGLKVQSGEPQWANPVPAGAEDLPPGAWGKIMAQIRQDQSQVAKLTANDGAATDIFGHSVSVSGDTVVVGAPRNDASASNSGAAYIFERNQGGGTIGA